MLSPARAARVLRRRSSLGLEGALPPADPLGVLQRHLQRCPQCGSHVGTIGTCPGVTTSARTMASAVGESDGRTLARSAAESLPRISAGCFGGSGTSWFSKSRQNPPPAPRSQCHLDPSTDERQQAILREYFAVGFVPWIHRASPCLYVLWPHDRPRDHGSKSLPSRVGERPFANPRVPRCSGRRNARSYTSGQRDGDAVCPFKRVIVSGGREVPVELDAGLCDGSTPRNIRWMG
jgi:hypothetical protein